MRLVRRSPWITLNFIKMINNYPTGAQFKLTREHFVSKFRRNFFSFKVAQYSPCAVLKTTTIRVNSKQLIMWFISNDGVWIFVLYHKCTVQKTWKCHAKRFLTMDVDDIQQRQKYVKLIWNFERNLSIFITRNDIYGLTFYMSAQCAKGWFRSCFIRLNRFHNIYTSP